MGTRRVLLKRQHAVPFSLPVCQSPSTLGRPLGQGKWTAGGGGKNRLARVSRMSFFFFFFSLLAETRESDLSG